LSFANNLDPRVKSSLSEEELIFPPYNALQLQTILANRAGRAFKEESLAPGVIAKCAAYAAREHGDARRALELLRVAGELAERKQESNITIAHLDHAEEKIEKERFIDVVKTQPKQFQTVLFAILANKGVEVSTGDIYNDYFKLCNATAQRPLTQRRVSDIIAELDMFGLITAKVISKGRFGRTREISLALPDTIIDEMERILRSDLGL
ncbi:cell division control protein Cdc6, partial [Candidatus Woesearchaeota archaeon]|nr:cell division control protein Cdc6 [Candidatus Woesearchaeota archaeon]